MLARDLDAFSATRISTTCRLVARNECSFAVDQSNSLIWRLEPKSKYSAGNH
jgi:hypothetical protein